MSSTEAGPNSAATTLGRAGSDEPAASPPGAEQNLSSAQLREVCDLAAHVIPVVNRRFRVGGNELGIGMRSALFELERGGPRRSGDLARIEGVAAPTMTRMLAAMAERGYVERRPDPDDGRACLVKITEVGSQALIEARNAYAARIEVVLRELDPDELVRVGEALQALVDVGLAG